MRVTDVTKAYALRDAKKELENLENSSRVITTGKVSEWAKALHWIKNRRNNHPFAISLRIHLIKKKTLTEAQKEAAINIYRSKTSNRDLTDLKELSVIKELVNNQQPDISKEKSKQMVKKLRNKTLNKWNQSLRNSGISKLRIENKELRKLRKLEGRNDLV